LTPTAAMLTLHIILQKNMVTTRHRTASVKPISARNTSSTTAATVLCTRCHRKTHQTEVIVEAAAINRTIVT